MIAPELEAPSPSLHHQRHPTPERLHPVMMNDKPSRVVRSGGLAAGGLALALALPLAACSADEPADTPEPTNISIAPSSAPPPTSQTPSPPTASSAAPTPPTDPSIAQSEGPLDAAGAVAVAESAVEDGTVVEVSKDDDNAAIEWEVTVRAGDNGRELRIAAADGTILSNRAHSLSAAQRGDLPTVAVRDAIGTAQKRVKDGEVTDAELTQENNQRVWDLSVDVAGGDEWDVWIDASSGKVLREERD
jgi:uncharacterized membrane protein YkoI